MSTIDVVQRYRAALAPCRPDGRAAPNQASLNPAGRNARRPCGATARGVRRIGAVLLASLAFATTGAALAAGERVDCAAAAESVDQKIALCTRVIADDAQSATSRAEAYDSRGTVYFNTNDLDGAISDFNAASKLDPDLTLPYFALAYRRRGVGFAQRKDFERAIADYDEAIRLDPASFEDYYDRGSAFAAKNDLDHAVADFSEAIKLNPGYALAYNSRGLSYQRQGDLDRAISDYGEAIRINPGLAVAYNNRGFVEIRKGDYERAIADAGEAISRNPNLAIAYDTRGYAYFNRTDYERALSDYGEAIKRNPRLPSVYGHRGVLYRARGEYDRSIADLDQAIALDASFVYAYDSRCNTYYSKKSYDNAIADCSQAIRLNPKDDFAYATRGLARAEKRDYDGAVADASEAIRLNPKSVSGYNSRGAAYRLKKDFDAAIADFNAAIALDPKFASAYGNRGSAYQEKGDSEHAIADFSRAIEINPNLFQAYNVRGKALAAKGEGISAVADFNNAIRLNPAFVEAYDNRALAYIGLHRTNDAIADLRKAQSIDPTDKFSRDRLAALGAAPLAPLAPAPLPLAPATGADPDLLAKAMGRLSIDLPIGVAGVDPVRKPLEDLGREPCDQQAITLLAHGLEQIGRKRDSANAQLRFSAACGGHAASLRAAANILLALSDFNGAAAAASDLIKLEPREDGNYFLRALAYDRAGAAKKAIDDYGTAIELFGNKANLGSDGHLAMARNYEKLGQFCDAAAAVEAWVALNPQRNDSSKMQAIIADDTAKGKCEDPNGRGEETFRMSAQKNVVRLPVTLNGVRGTFIMDTGATFVTLNAAFAQKAKVQIDPDSTLKMHTANGIADAKRGRAATIQVRSLQAKDVEVVVQSSGAASYGEGVDGLLGMSFLSRFKVSIDTESVRISSRNAK
jgi:clan AA aspartic protease (TIGR02281 family)